MNMTQSTTAAGLLTSELLQNSADEVIWGVREECAMEKAELHTGIVGLAELIALA